MRFIHISDVYLGYTPDPGTDWSEDRKTEIRETFLDILKDCNAKDVQLLLIAGNLFASTPSEEDLKWLDEQLLTLEHTRTLLLAGDADPIIPGAPLEKFKFESKTVVFPAGRTTNAYLKGINTCVTGFSYRKSEEPGRILEGINPGRAGSYNILLGAGGTKNHMPFRKDVLAKKGFDYVALGGSRKPTHVLKNRMAYAGSPEPIGPEDQGKHGYILGEMTEEGTRIVWCPIARRKYITLTYDIRPETEREDIARMAEEKMLAMGHEHIYTIVLRGFTTRDARFDFSKIKRRLHVLAVLDQTISEKEQELMTVENENNLVGGFVREISDSYMIEEKIRDKAIRYGVEALITAGE